LTVKREGFMEPTHEKSETVDGSATPTAPFTSLAGLARHITIAGLSGLIAGVLVGGIGGRLFMRIAGAIAGDVAQGRRTEAGFTVGEVTMDGSLGLILFIGVFSGLAVASYYVMFFPWIAWAGRWRGVMFGITGFAAASATSDLLNPDNIDFVILRNEPIVVGMIVLLFLALGVVIDWLYRLFDTYVPAPDPNVNAVFYVLGGVGLFLGGVTATVIVTGDACDCDPLVGVVWSIVIVAAATIGWWLSVLVARSPTSLGRLSTAAGYVGTAGVLVFGLIRALSDAAAIIG
jgi:hypothetical protein